jgi:exonuclease III
MDMLNFRYKILSWNVRGLNSAAKQEDVKQNISLFNPDLLCLQETKLASIDSVTIRKCLGSQFENSYAFLPADGTREVIILVSNCSSMSLSNTVHTNHTLSAQVLDIRRNCTWMVTVVYEPQGDQEKQLFISELRSIKQSVSGLSWVTLI